MHYLDKTVEYLRDAGSGFPNISDIYSDISSECVWGVLKGKEFSVA